MNDVRGKFGEAVEDWPRSWVIAGALLVFLAAAAFRLTGLGQFWTTDELFWVRGTRLFLGGLLAPSAPCLSSKEGIGLACTLRAGHPGVMNMWFGVVSFILYYLAKNPGGSLLQFVTTMPTSPIDKELIAWLQWPVALAASALAALSFLLLCSILRSEGARGKWLALMASMFFALSPFEIALSRVFHLDIMETIFSTLSLLVLFDALENKRGRRYLLLSGLCAGLAGLAKIPALILIVFMVFISAWRLLRSRLIGKAWQRRDIYEITLDGLSWLAACLAAMFIFWPAMWVIPQKTIQTVFSIGEEYATEGHAQGNYFFGQVSTDPGFLFYPVNWALRTTPPLIVGVLAAAGCWLFAGAKGITGLFSVDGWRRRLGLGDEKGPMWRLLALSLFFALAYTAAMSVVDKKQDRYILPALPFIAILAAGGWVKLAEVLNNGLSRLGRRGSRTLGYGFCLVLIIGCSGWFSGREYPYYFTYYNPLFGGIKAASGVVTIGWGEGLEKAAAYLNQQPGAEKSLVYSWYSPSFAPYYRGETDDFPEKKESLLAADYLVFYINQKQRSLPSKDYLKFAEKGLTLDKTIELDGLTYAWIYRSFGLSHTLKGIRYNDEVQFLGWKYLPAGIDQKMPTLRPGENLDVILCWLPRQESAKASFFIRLLDSQGNTHLEATYSGRAALDESGRMNEGNIVPEIWRFIIPADFSAGEYTLRFGLHLPDGGEYVFDLGDQSYPVAIKAV